MPPSLSPAALQTIDALAVEGVNALPQRGLEVGGLLWGSEPSGVHVEAAEAVAIEHRFGPSFQLSDADVASFQQAIEAGKRSGRQVLGHFRSHTKGPLGVTETDRRLAELTGLARPWMLLIAASRTGPFPAKLFRLSGGDWVELAALTLPAAMGEVRTGPEPAAGVPEPRRRWLRPVLAGGLLLCAGIVAVSVWRHVPAARSPAALPPATLPPAAGGIGLTFRRTGRQLTLSWDTSIPALQAGDLGLLTIRDGNVQRKIELTAEQLRGGRLEYAFEGATVEAGLQLYRGREHLSGETAIFIAGTPPVPEVAASTPVPNPTPTKERRREAKARAKPPARSVPLRAKKAIPTKPPVRETRAAAATPQRSIQPLPAASPPPVAASPAPVVAEPPHLALSLPAAPAPIAGLPGPAIAPPPITYVAAVPIRRINPTVPAGLRHLIQDPVSIEVRVTIDAEGKVVDAKPVNASGSSQKLLSPGVVQAARLWRFEPARKNGQRVGSETTLRFAFER